jgi:hypothetical protein
MGWVFEERERIQHFLEHLQLEGRSFTKTKKLFFLSPIEPTLSSKGGRGGSLFNKAYSSGPFQQGPIEASSSDH